MNDLNLTIRLATEHDLPAMTAFDHIAALEEERRQYLRHAVHEQSCYVAATGDILGYAILEYSFFRLGYVSLLYVHPEHRWKGIGAALMHHLEEICRTEKLFTSTNLSNLPMQRLLTRLHYKLSGVVHDLDEGDPELFYVKYLPAR